MDWKPCSSCASQEIPDITKHRVSDMEYNAQATCWQCGAETKVCWARCGGFIEAEMKAMYLWNSGEVRASKTSGQY
jgi:hypothetical protein